MKGQLIVVDLGPSRPAFKVGNLGLGRIPVSSGCSPCFRVSVSPWRNEIAKDSDSDPFSRHGLLTSPETSGRGEHCEWKNLCSLRLQAGCKRHRGENRRQDCGSVLWGMRTETERGTRFSIQKGL